MHPKTVIKGKIHYVGVNDRNKHLFEGMWPLPYGVSYNSYLIDDEMVALVDTVDICYFEVYLRKIKSIIGERPIQYLIINHMEPDHSGSIRLIKQHYPDIIIVGNKQTFGMLNGYHGISTGLYEVKEGDTLSVGRHQLSFYMAPMVHWPEAMVSYDTVDKILFSADGFGTFGAINGNLFADEVNFERDWLDDARRYFINIVGKYGVQVQNLLKKAATLEIKMICPLHGPVWRENLGWFIEKYDTWSSYKPEDQAVMIAYASIYGNTENAAEILASKLADKGVKNIAMYDVSVTDPSVIVSESFRCSHLVFAAPSYNGGIFTKMETVLSELKAHSLQNRTVAIMENGTWAPVAGRQMREIFAGMKNIELLEEGVTIRSAVKEAQEASLEALAEKIASSLQ